MNMLKHIDVIGPDFVGSFKTGIDLHVVKLKNYNPIHCNIRYIPYFCIKLINYTLILFR